jgi:hypothetical protein
MAIPPVEDGPVEGLEVVLKGFQGSFGDCKYCGTTDGLHDEEKLQISSCVG